MANVNGASTSGIYTEPEAAFIFKTEKSGKLISLSCNIHGLWMNGEDLKFNFFQPF